MAQPPDHTDAPIGFLLGRASRVMTLRADRAIQEEGYTIRLEHWVILQSLADGVLRSQKAFVDLMGKDKTGVTRLLKSMEKEGWVERCTRQADRRSKFVSLTEKGDRLRQDVAPIVQRVNREVEEELPPGRLEEGKSLLEAIFRLLKHELEEAPPRPF